MELYSISTIVCRYYKYHKAYSYWSHGNLLKTIYLGGPTQRVTWNRVTVQSKTTMWMRGNRTLGLGWFRFFHLKHIFFHQFLELELFPGTSKGSCVLALHLHEVFSARAPSSRWCSTNMSRCLGRATAFFWRHRRQQEVQQEWNYIRFS